MEDQLVCLVFHHKGKFQNNEYTGGKEDIVAIKPDRFSYTVLMEHVKDDLKYSEIGGVYVKKGEPAEWKLLETDLDVSRLVNTISNGGHVDVYVDNIIDKRIEPVKTQPHVLVRPRQNICAGIN